jgi:hypothetical protein
LNGVGKNKVELQGPVQSEVPPEARPFELIYAGGHLFGDWNGLKTDLKNRGITPSLTLVTDIAGNPIGGKRKGVTALPRCIGQTRTGPRRLRSDRPRCR